MRTAPLFYAPPEKIKDNIIELPEKEAHHASSVMRMKAGEVLVVVDGIGNGYRGHLKKIGRGKATITVQSVLRNFGEPDLRLTLAAGLSVGQKFDATVEKGTELGVSRFVPLLTEKSKVNFKNADKAEARRTRLQRVALAAIKQCRRSYRPDISLPTTLLDFLEEREPEEYLIFFHRSHNSKPLEQLQFPDHPKRVTVVVGPESGFSDNEAEMLSGVGGIAVSLGDRILRTETAAQIATALVMYRLGEFS